MRLYVLCRPKYWIKVRFWCLYILTLTCKLWKIPHGVVVKRVIDCDPAHTHESQFPDKYVGSTPSGRPELLPIFGFILENLEL